MLARAWLAIAVLASLGIGTAHADKPRPPAGQGTFTKQHYVSTQGERDYWIYLPPGDPDAERPLVVFLHGCNESATEAATATRFNDLARQRGFIVVYPQQNVTPNASAPFVDGNGIGCWNWFLPEDQKRDSGETAVIAGLTREVAAQYDVDRRRIFVSGISAGGTMTANLAAAYPDLYAAAAVLAGCGYGTCGDVTGQLAYQQMGPRARVVPMLIENGTADTLNNMAMASTLLSGWLGTDDLADDGSLNNSVSRQPASVKHYAVDQAPNPGSGDACVHNNSWTCPGGVVGFQGSYPYTVSTYTDARGCDVLQFWAIHGMEHAHPHAPSGGPYTDPLGPDVTTASYEYFMAHPMPKAHGKPSRC